MCYYTYVRGNNKNLSNEYLEGFIFLIFINKILGGIQMTKVLRVKWRPRKICTFIGICSVIVFLLDLCFFIWFSDIPDHKEVWFMSCTIASIVLFAVIACIYIGIAVKAKNTEMVVYCQEKICKKGNQELYYINFNTNRTTLVQKMFGLVTVEFRNQFGEKILFKDVNKEILNYL